MSDWWKLKENSYPSSRGNMSKLTLVKVVNKIFDLKFCLYAHGLGTTSFMNRLA